MSNYVIRIKTAESGTIQFRFNSEVELRSGIQEARKLNNPWFAAELRDKQHGRVLESSKLDQNAAKAASYTVQWGRYKDTVTRYLCLGEVAIAKAIEINNSRMSIGDPSAEAHHVSGEMWALDITREYLD